MARRFAVWWNRRAGYGTCRRIALGFGGLRYRSSPKALCAAELTRSTWSRELLEAISIWDEKGGEITATDVVFAEPCGGVSGSDGFGIE